VYFAEFRWKPRVMNRQKLFAIIALLLMPIVLLGWLFLNQTLKDIHFAKSELVGTAVTLATVPLLTASLEGDEQNLSKALSDFVDVTRIHSAELNLQAERNALLNALSKPDGNMKDVFPQIASFLIEVADASKLTLDPDLDSYYMMDVLITRIPEIIARIGDLTEIKLRHFELVEQNETPARYNAIEEAFLHDDLVAATGRLQPARTALAVSLSKALLNAGPRDERAGLEAKAIRLLQRLDRYHFAIADNVRLHAHQQRPGTNTLGKTQSDLVTEVLDSQNVLYRSIDLFSQLAANELEFMLEKRIAHLEQQRNMAVAASVLIASLALLIAFGMFRGTLSELDQRVLFLAHHDELTGLRNRASFMKDVESALIDSAQHKTRIALHILDLDNFKMINDTLGHPTGDIVLQEMSKILARHAGTNGVVARFGGDEFVILQRDVIDDQAVSDFAWRIVSEMRNSMEIDGRSIRTAISIGSAVSSLKTRNADEFLQQADIALYSAKEQGRDRAQIFTDALARALRDEQQIEADVRRGLADGAFELNFQPFYDVHGRVLKGFEALLRLKDLAGKPISPARFVPVAEKLGLIAEIGRWVLNEACRTAASWPNDLIVAVNFAPVQLHSGSPRAEIAEALAQSGLDPKQLQIEITEDSILHDTDHVLAELHAIRELGVSIAIDDFGTGYSSLSNLWRFPIDKLKVDRSFVTAIDSGDTHATKVLGTVILLGHSLGMCVVAEGVETPAQVTKLVQLDCDEVQGFIYGRPMPAVEIARTIMASFHPPGAADHLAPANTPIKMAS
jgi:diguanylate cyclase (GGDEF)-like protein